MPCHLLSSPLATRSASRPRLKLNQDVSTLAVDVFLFALKVALIFFASWTVIGVIALQQAGEGLTTARDFTRVRRCTLAGYFRIV